MSSNGTVVANYYYDAYGEILSITDADGEEITNTSSVAFLNPLRYRGYVYDNDTGFYYLQSRYYDPTTKRFVNADSTTILMFSLVDDENIGLSITNLFAYCYNNPIINTDKIGLIAGVDDAVVWGLIALFAVCSLLVAYISTPQFKRSWVSFCNALGYGLTSIWSTICGKATAVWKWSANIVRQAYAAVSLYITVYKADVKIKNTVKRSSKNQYWKASLVKNCYVAIGREITYSQAVSEVKAGRSVFTATKSQAKMVAKAAGGNKEPMSHGKHKNAIGYYNHYHVKGHANGAHVWYLF